MIVLRTTRTRDIRGDLDLDLVGRSTTFDTVPMMPPPVTMRSPRRSARASSVVLRLLLLRPDHQEIEHDEDQDERQELQGILVHHASVPDPCA